MTAHRILLSGVVAAAAVLVGVAACSPAAEDCASTCGGCCDSSGVCQDGKTAPACGVSGNACAVCGPNESCVVGICIGVGGVDSGTDSGTDAGQDAGPDAGPCSNVGDSCASNGDCCTSHCDATKHCAPRPGDECTSAMDIVFQGSTANKTFNAAGNNTGYRNDSSSACGGTGPDRVWKMLLTQTRDISVVVNSDPTLQAVVYLTEGELPACNANILTCNRATSGGASVGITKNGLPPGVYYLWIDGHEGSTGAFGFNGTSVPAATGENCSSIIPLDFSSTNNISMTGDTMNATDDNNSGCDSPTASGPDRVYSFTVSQPRTFSATVAPIAPAWDVGISLRQSTCTTGNELACKNSGGGTAQTIGPMTLQVGTYFIWVDGFSGADKGRYNLNVQLD